MFTLRSLIISIVFSLGLAASLPAHADSSEIGNVEEVHLALYGTVSGGDSERVYINDGVFADELIETVKKSNAQIRFVDDMDLWLGPSSSLTLDSFIFDPDLGTGEMVAELGRGLFRFVSGQMPRQNVEIFTPVAVIGIRGTDFSVEVAANGTTQVTVYSGAVTVAPRGGGAPANVNAGETADVDSPTGEVDVSPASQDTPPASVSDGVGVAAAQGGGGGSGGGGSSCFTADTQIVMADGQLKEIGNIAVGDVVLGQDGAHNIVTGLEWVTLGGRLLYGFDGGVPFVTAEHPFMTDQGWKSIDPTATADENPSLQVSRLEVGDSVVTMQRDYWHLAALGDPSGTGDTALGRQHLRILGAVAANSETVLYNLLLDGDHAYWVVPPAEVSPLRTVSTAPALSEDGTAFLVHNKGG